MSRWKRPWAWLLALAAALVLAVTFRSELAGIWSEGDGSNRAALQPWVVPPPVPPAGPKVLVLYDRPLGTSQEKLAFSYAVMLGNLLGHFDAQVTLLPTASYTAGMIESRDATFYMGATHESPLPEAFLEDVARTGKPFVWFKYNIWKLAANRAWGLRENRGIEVHGLRSFNSKPSPQNPAPGFFDTVTYKGLPFVKFYRYDPKTDVLLADPDVGHVSIVDPSKAKVVAQMRNTKTGETAPYVVRSGSFWYVADAPLSFIGPRDRYMVLADLLHDMLGVDHAEEHKAMVRLEDLHAMGNPKGTREVVDYLHGKKIPFSMAVIPRYEDPLGAYNRGTALTVPLSRARKFRETLDYGVARGGEIVAHGYTHQYRDQPNGSNGTSGEDYEFWNIVTNTPVAEDSVEWARGRLQAALEELRSNGYTPVAWTTPHYHASAATSRAVPQVFGTTYQRAVYYTADKPDLNAVIARDYAMHQFYPYPIARDYYGQRVIPENLGNIQFNVGGVPFRLGPMADPSLGYSADDILLNARYALVVRDGYLSFFFHPFLLNVGDDRGWNELTKTVEGINRLGVKWTSPSALAP
jgi:uncharacterized protein YdaL